MCDRCPPPPPPARHGRARVLLQRVRHATPMWARVGTSRARSLALSSGICCVPVATQHVPHPHVHHPCTHARMPSHHPPPARMPPSPTRHLYTCPLTTRHLPLTPETLTLTHRYMTRTSSGRDARAEGKLPWHMYRARQTGPSKRWGGTGAGLSAAHASRTSPGSWSVPPHCPLFRDSGRNPLVSK